MKIKFFVLALVLCLSLCVLCACGDSETTPTEADTTPVATEAQENPTDKGLFVTEDPDDLPITFPEDMQGVVLPEIELDDSLGVFSSEPITDPVETEPEATEPATEAPVATSWSPDVLPEDVFED